LARQLRAASKPDGSGIDLDALSAIVEKAYVKFDRQRAIGALAARSMEDKLKTADTLRKWERDSVLTAILDSSSDGMLVLRDEGQIVAANTPAEGYFGADHGGLRGLAVDTLLGMNAQKVARGEYAPGELPELSGTGLDGRVFPVEYSCADLDLADGKRQLWIVRDISGRVRAQREVMESRMRFQDFAESSSDCFWEMDRTLSSVEVSAAGKSDLIARLPSLLTPAPGGRVPQGVAEEGWRALRQSISARERFRLRLDLHGKDGENLYVAVSGKPVFDLDGEFCGYRGTGRDVTHDVAAREAARRTERRLVEAMDAAPCAVALVDAELNLVSGNSALRTLASAKGARLPFGHSFTGFLADSTNADAISPEILRGLAQSGEMREIAIGRYWYLLAARGLSGGGMVLIFSDVTVLMERERELADAKRAAESANRLKSQFLATMSHELRTPLNAILGFSEVIRDSVFGRTTASVERYAEYAGSIHASGGHLLSLISEILDHSKIEAGNYVLDIRKIDLCKLIEGALAMVAPSAEKAELELKAILPTAPVWLAADERAVRQIAINLLANAVKFTPNGGSITAEVRTLESEVEFSVTDTGIGIAKEHIPLVFDLFRQVDSSIARRHEGTGLGLAITKRLVELHSGAIAIESQLGEGTKVSVTLPRRVPSAALTHEKRAVA
jgi:PAS domain S-box-containing protein